MPDARTFARPDGRRFVVGTPTGDLPPGELFASVDEGDTEARAALEQLGFEPVRRQLELMLPTGLPAVHAPAGCSVLRADELPERELRLLDDELRQDVPGTDGWRWRPEDFHAETYESPHFDPAVYLVAVADEEPTAICRIWLRPERPKLGFIGVRRSLRRRGVARWLVGEAFAVLAARGHAEVWTEVDETNAASRALLEGLGGRRVGASLELRRGPAVEIRQARADDTAELADLAARTWLDAFGDSLPPQEAAAEVARTRSPERFLRALDDRTILVAEREGSLAGYAELGPGTLERLYVETALHDHGIGSRSRPSRFHIRCSRASA